MTVWVYVQTVDSGYAPNPKGPMMSLAVCKPCIRKRAKVGDWVVGVRAATIGYPKHTLIRSNDTSPLGGDHVRIFFAVKITHTVSMEEYDRMSQEECWN